MRGCIISSLLLFLLNYTNAQPIRCMNFYGLETESQGLVCDWTHEPEWYLKQLSKNLLINTIRLPFSYELIQFHPLTNLDKMMETCKKLRLRVILDYHRTWWSHQGPTPEEGITMQEFIETWITVLRRYPSVYGVGIFNEIQSDNFTYTMNMHRQVIEAIELAFPNNQYTYFCGCPRWGGDCQYMNLADMPTWDRTFIEVHKYVFSGPSDSPDWDKSMPTSIPASHWFVGEVGWKHGVPEERAWAEGFLSYLNYRNITNLCAWTIAHSGDTEGWWRDDCQTFDWDKASLLNSYFTKSLKTQRKYVVIDGNHSSPHVHLRLG